MTLSFPLSQKAIFYLRYFTDKVFGLWFEVRTPKLRMFLYEMVYSALKFVSRAYLFPSPFGVDYVETVFGKFRIRPRTVDMSNVSPAFERRDINHMIELLRRLASEGKSILFLDIGGDLGTFSVTMGNALRGYDRLSIMAFEPSPESFSLMRENVEMNGLADRAELVNSPLYSLDGIEMDFDFRPQAPGASGLAVGAREGRQGLTKVTTRTLDSVLGPRASEYDVLVFKLDVEGVESEVLKGSAMTILHAPESYFLVEDFVNPEIIGYMEGMGAEFTAKLTPYNSFWRMGSGKGGAS